jgi:hypothetical protein
MTELVSEASSEDIWCVYHVEHSDALRHRDRVGRIRIGKRDELCLIGTFSSLDTARSAILSVITKPGFIDEPDCFAILEFPVNVDLWPLGFRPSLHRKTPDAVIG